MDASSSLRRRRGELRNDTRALCPQRSLASVEGGNDRLRDHLHRTSRDLAGLAQPRERLLLGEPLALHQQSLRPLDRLARGERLRERVGLLAQRQELLVAGAGGANGRQQVLLPERLYEVAE